jgi:hypothetical protein
MHINRRNVLIGGAAAIATIGGSTATALTMTKEDEHLAILLTNLRRNLDPHHVQFAPLMENVTQKAFAHIIADNRIQVQPMTGPVDLIEGRTLCARSRMLGVRYTLLPTEIAPFSASFDTVPWCNGRSLIFPDMTSIIASEIASEHQQMLLLLANSESIWVPYVLAIPVLMIDPNTFQPMVAFRTRYALLN